MRWRQLVALQVEHVQVRQGHCAIVDLVGKGGHIRTVTVPQRVKDALGGWTSAAGIAKTAPGKSWGRFSFATLSSASAAR